MHRTTDDAPNPKDKRMRIFLRARERFSPTLSAHLAALAYMSDSWFVGSVARAHDLKHFTSPKQRSDGTERVQREVGMMVSLDHAIFFHRPREVRADEWILSERQTPWAGDGRGLVVQRIWAASGALLATCTQEGLVRLKQGGETGGDRPKL